MLKSYLIEILAICTAAEHLLESRKKMENIAIFTDSLLTLQTLNSVDPDQMIQGLHSSLVKLSAQFSVSLQWVPAHVGLTGNKKADRLEIEHPGCAENQAVANHRCSAEHVLLHALVKYMIQLALQHTFI